MPLVLFLATLRISSIFGSKLFFDSVSTKTGFASESVTNSGKDTQYGEKIITSSPAWNNAWQAKYKLCFSPFETKTCFGEIFILFSRSTFLQIASLSSIIPAPAVYLVKPLSIADFAAPIILSGVLKSG